MHEPPPISTDIIDLGPDMFASADWRVIARMGQNYYLACSEVVFEKPEGGATTCIKPLHHKTWEHEDWEGRTRDRDIEKTRELDERVQSTARNLLTRSGLDLTEVYNALNALHCGNIKLVRG